MSNNKTFKWHVLSEFAKVVSFLQAFSKCSWIKSRRCSEEEFIGTIAVGGRIRLADNIDIIAGSKDTLTDLTSRLSYQHMERGIAQ